MNASSTQNALKAVNSQKSFVSLPPSIQGHDGFGGRKILAGTELKLRAVRKSKENAMCERVPINQSQGVGTTKSTDQAKFASERVSAHRHCVPMSESQSVVAAANVDSRTCASGERKSGREASENRRSRLIKVIAFTDRDVTHGGLQDGSNHKGTPPKIQYLRVIPINSNTVVRGTLPLKHNSTATSAANRPQPAAVCGIKAPGPTGRGDGRLSNTTTLKSNEMTEGTPDTRPRYSTPSLSQIAVAEWIMKMRSWIRGEQNEHSQQEVGSLCRRQAYWGIAPCREQGSTSSKPEELEEGFNGAKKPP
ncbi:unnamed protein product [Schistocephalus solidus]|uniref:Uncharacterized protein n=1 Tax=Schistocephalus solidus TaxID=70667 RepID=A0A183TM91_SCHSO|nr:unnamed protein product [Schistocephalus solidus]